MIFRNRRRSQKLINIVSKLACKTKSHDSNCQLNPSHTLDNNLLLDKRLFYPLDKSVVPHFTAVNNSAATGTLQIRAL
jgi:hypothetical protein